MAIGSVKLHWAGTTGDRGLRGGLEYTAVWFVTMTSKFDQAQTVLNAFEAHASGATRGDVYAFASDTATGPSYLRRLTAERKQDSQIHWEVKGHYSADDSRETGRDINGVPTADPLEYAPVVRVRNVQFQKPVERATYISGLKPGGFADAIIVPGDEIVPCNSAFIPFDDPIMRDEAHFTIEIEMNVSSYNGDNDDLYENLVNTDCFHITKPLYSLSLSGGAASYAQSGTYTRIVHERTAKIREIVVSFETFNEIDYIKVTYIMDINPHTWRPEVLDKGTTAGGWTGSPDGRGGLIGQGGSIIPTGGALGRRITDLEDRPVPSPVLFDGDGEPLDTRTPGWRPVHLKFVIYEESEYTSIPFLIATGLIEQCTGTAT